jgi:hypothetical protein
LKIFTSKTMIPRTQNKRYRADKLVFIIFLVLTFHGMRAIEYNAEDRRFSSQEVSMYFIEYTLNLIYRRNIERDVIKNTD